MVYYNRSLRVQLQQHKIKSDMLAGAYIAGDNCNDSDRCYSYHHSPQILCLFRSWAPYNGKPYSKDCRGSKINTRGGGGGTCGKVDHLLW